MRYRLFNNTARAIVQYTTLLLLFGVATYKAVNLPFLATTLGSELSSVFFLRGKLQHLAGGCALGLTDKWPSFSCALELWSGETQPGKG